MPSVSSATKYVYRHRLPVPLDFAYAWCTDFSPEDPGLRGLDAERRILRRGRRDLEFEDLEWTASGWWWSRVHATFHPPAHWHADAVGNYRSWSLDYRLRPLGPGATELCITGLRRPMVLGERNPTDVAMRKEMRGIWDAFGRAMLRDYRRGRRPRRR